MLNCKSIFREGISVLPSGGRDARPLGETSPRHPIGYSIGYIPKVDIPKDATLARETLGFSMWQLFLWARHPLLLQEKPMVSLRVISLR